jgi:hypothetical protein
MTGNVTDRYGRLERHPDPDPDPDPDPEYEAIATAWEP